MRQDYKLCACERNNDGCIKCHNCGEYVKRLCWNCRTPRGEGRCPTSPIEPINVTHADQLRREGQK